jgi:hypothetical protein
MKKVKRNCGTRLHLYAYENIDKIVRNLLSSWLERLDGLDDDNSCKELCLTQKYLADIMIYADVVGSLAKLTYQEQSPTEPPLGNVVQLLHKFRFVILLSI